MATAFANNNTDAHPPGCHQKTILQYCPLSQLHCTSDKAISTVSLLYTWQDMLHGVSTVKGFTALGVLYTLCNLHTGLLHTLWTVDMPDHYHVKVNIPAGVGVDAACYCISEVDEGSSEVLVATSVKGTLGSCVMTGTSNTTDGVGKTCTCLHSHCQKRCRGSTTVTRDVVEVP